MTSVVQKTPVKETLTEADSCPNGLVESSCSGSDTSDGSDADDGATEDAATVEKPPCSNLFSKISEPVKRPAVASPEVSSENKKKDKKKKKNNISSSTAVRSSSRQGLGKSSKK